MASFGGCGIGDRSWDGKLRRGISWLIEYFFVAYITIVLMGNRFIGLESRVGLIPFPERDFPPFSRKEKSERAFPVPF